MLTLLTPWFAAAAAAALLPLVLHLIQSRRAVRVPFSTLRFLKAARARSSHRLRMQHWLLWFLRTLLPLLLAMAFAMPIARTSRFGGWLGRARRDVAIVLDGSMSMRYRVDGRPVWDAAVEVVARVITGLSDHDRVAIFLAGEDVVPVLEQLSGDRETALARLETLAPSFGTSRLAPAVMAAADALGAEARGHERELHLVTDYQALPWLAMARRDPAARDDGAAADMTDGPAWDPARIPERTVGFVTLLGAPFPDNTAPVDIVIEPGVIMAGRPFRVTVTLAHTGPARDTTVTLSVQDVEIGRRSVAVGGPRTARATFGVAGLEAGRHALRVEIPEDPLLEDNRLHAVLRVRDALPTLVVGDRDDARFVVAALQAGQVTGDAVAVRDAGVDELGRLDLGGYACVILCNALPLRGQDMDALEGYVLAGGTLLMLPGDRAVAGDYAAWTWLPALPRAVVDVPRAGRRQTLRWERPEHGLLRELASGAGVPTLMPQRRLAFAAMPAESEIMMTSGAEHPFLILRSHGRGAVLLAAVAGDRSWSDFPLNPYFAPILHQIVRYAGLVGKLDPFIRVTASAALADILPWAGREAALLDPDGRAVSIREVLADGRRIRHVEDLTRPGIYRLTDAERSAPLPALAVNPAAAESDLTPVDPADVPGLLGFTPVMTAHGPEELERAIERHRVGRRLDEPLLWLALLVAVAEFVYANHLRRAPPALRDVLNIDAGGRIRPAAAKETA